jgi:solute carrier family 25 iron transporter 28/37
LAHGDDGNEFLQQLSLPKAMLAGSFAGMIEHCCMFPIDTIKTRMQVFRENSAINNGPRYSGLINSLKQVTKEEGFWRLYRGLPAVCLSAAPSHALYFGSYELVKQYMGASRQEHTPLASVTAGIVATLCHDALSTPMDVVKQRMQLYGSKHSKLFSTIKHIAKEEGLKAFYSSYMTTILLNIPYISVHFLVYEALHTILHDTPIDDTPVADLLCGSAAASLGAICSTPLDVIKTRIQTHNWVEGEALNQTTAKIIRQMVKEEGYKVFAKGMTARVALHAPSAAICWAVYEALKRSLNTSEKCTKPARECANKRSHDQPYHGNQ